ncbi:MAG: DNA-formamidopyrimidine glycosylase family protein, partial [Woeseiaceae bacterium]
MPEGPEIRLAADKIAKVLVNQGIVEAELRPPALTRFEKKLTGAHVTAIDTRGKAMLTRFDNGLTLYSHNQLYGRWFTTRKPRMPRTNRQ